MMRLILIGVGLSALALPMLYVLGMITAWAKLSNKWARRSVVGVMSALLVTAAVRAGYLSYGGSDSYQDFLAHCEKYKSGEVHGSTVVTDEILADYDWISRSPDKHTEVGNVVLPLGMAKDLALGGIQPYAAISSRAGAGFDRWAVNAAGRVDFTRRLSTVDIQYGYTWESNSLSTNPAVASATLAIKDLSNDEVLGFHPVFSWLGPTGKRMPYPTWVPGAVRAPVVETCPQPIQLIRFIKSVLRPADTVAGHD